VLVSFLAQFIDECKISSLTGVGSLERKQVN
jgi:hypothetical protein